MYNKSHVVLWLALVSLLWCESHAQSLQVAGGFDTRYRKADNAPNTFELHGAFLNLRKVFSDDLGDRVILVTQYDLEDNFSESHFYYTYAQLKGPLGKINLRVGRYVFPFGLLTYYDTERLLLHTMEATSLGIKTDVGAQIFGHLDDFDYAFSISNGVGRYWKDIDDNKLMIARIGMNLEDSRFGVSYLNGRIFTPVTREAPTESYAYKQLLALDVQQYVDLFTLRGELVYGSDSDANVVGGFLGVDYTILPSFDVNLKYTIWNKSTNRHLPGIGFTYSLLGSTYVRAADTFEITDGKVVNNEIQVQIYVEFLNQL